jgi:hypothetical protein
MRTLWHVSFGLLRYAWLDSNHLQRSLWFTDEVDGLITGRGAFDIIIDGPFGLVKVA